MFISLLRAFNACIRNTFRSVSLYMYHARTMSEDHALRSNARVYVTSMPHVNSRVRSRATVQVAATAARRTGDGGRRYLPVRSFRKERGTERRNRTHHRSTVG